jgi:hypothetical protein
VAHSTSTEGARGMTSLRPTPQQERWLRIADREQQLRDAPWLAKQIGGWTRATLISRCAFFILGVFASALVAAVLDLLHVTHFLLVSGPILILAAEWLIRRKRLFGSGIEEALELSGILMIALQGLSSNASEDIKFWLLAGVALLVAGIRLLNPLFVMLSAAALSVALYHASVHGFASPMSASMQGLPSLIFASRISAAFCLVLACGALYLQRHQWPRPSIDEMFSWLIVSMPLGAYLWITNAAFGLTLDSLHHSALSKILPLLILMLFALTALTVGIRRRGHAPIIAFMICIGCVAHELRDLTHLPLQTKLILGGCVALLCMLGLDAYLRRPRRGITSNRLQQSLEPSDLVHLAGVSGLSPQAITTVAPFKGGGGDFGGGGASGSY